MNRKRLMAAVLALSIALSSLAAAGCGKKEKKEKEKERKPAEITKGMPWFSNRKFEACERYRTGDPIDYYDTRFVGMDSDKLCFITTGEYRWPLDADYSSINYDDYIFADLDIYDLDGTLLKTIDIHDGIDMTPYVPADQTAENCHFDAGTTSFTDGKLRINASVFLSPMNETRTYSVIYDVDSGKIESVLDLSEDSGSNDMFRDGSFSFDGYTIDSYTTFNEETEMFLKVTKPDGSSEMVSVSKKLSNTGILNINRIIYTGRNKALIKTYDNNYMTVYYELDLNTLKLSPYKEDTSWFTNYMEFFDPSYVDGTGYIVVTENSINKINFDKKEIEEILSFDSCNINRNVAGWLKVAAISDDRIVLTGSNTLDWNYGQMKIETLVYVLTKEKENPHAGKTVLTAASFEGYDYAFCEALCRFNDTNPDYFIMLDNRYSYYEKSIDGSMENINDDIGYYKFESSLYNELAMDLMAGEGPDLILGADSFYQINRDEYLIDLSKEISTDGLFANIIESAKTGGKLYRMPLTASYTGIITKRSRVGDGMNGFTYDQYLDFVNTICNGKDPIYYNQRDYFTLCLRYLYKDCITASGVDFGNADVKKLADFVRDNVTDPVDGEDISYVTSEIPGGYFEYIRSFDQMVEAYMGAGVEDIAFLGVPSSDGQGPLLDINASIAISAKTKAKDVLVEFIKNLLSDEIQTIFGEKDSVTPVNMAAFEKVAENDLNKANEKIRAYVKMNDAGIYYAEDIPRTEIDKIAIQNFKDMINSCAVNQSIDPAIVIIINEEMPAYFTGQKSFDDVVNLINNRVTTVLNEQG